MATWLLVTVKYYLQVSQFITHTDIILHRVTIKRSSYQYKEIRSDTTANKAIIVFGNNNILQYNLH